MTWQCGLKKGLECTLILALLPETIHGGNNVCGLFILPTVFGVLNNCPVLTPTPTPQRKKKQHHYNFRLHRESFCKLNNWEFKKQRRERK